MDKKIFVTLLVSLAVGAVSMVQAQSHKPYRIGVIHEGGTYNAVVEGLKDGLRGLGLEPGKDVLLEIRDMQGNRAAAGAAARSLEQAKVDLLCSLSTGDTIAAKGATKEVPIIFVIGTEAAVDGLIERSGRSRVRSRPKADIGCSLSRSVLHSPANRPQVQRMRSTEPDGAVPMVA